MRKQYHFRQSEDGLLAWDVHRLIDLSQAISPLAVQLSDVQQVDEPYWYSAGEPPPTCRDLVDHMRLVEAADLAYPIILSPDGRVMDGMHRIAKALLLGRSEIMAVRLAAIPAPDFIGVHPDALPYDDDQDDAHALVQADAASRHGLIQASSDGAAVAGSAVRATMNNQPGPKSAGKP